MQRECLFRVVASLAASPWIIFAVALAVRIFVLMHLLPEMADRGFTTATKLHVLLGHGLRARFQFTLAEHAVSAYCATTTALSLSARRDFQASRGVFLPITVDRGCLECDIFLNHCGFGFMLGKRVFGASVGIIAGWIWACWLHEAVSQFGSGRVAFPRFCDHEPLSLVTSRGSQRIYLALLFGAVAGIGALTNTNPSAIILLIFDLVVGL